MSFEFKGPSYRPMIQEAQQMKNNGGGGNLGYFKRRKKDDEKDNEQTDLFESTQDSFEHEVEEGSEENESGFDKLKGILGNFAQKAKDTIENVNKKDNPFM